MLVTVSIPSITRTTKKSFISNEFVRAKSLFDPFELHGRKGANWNGPPPTPNTIGNDDAGAPRGEGAQGGEGAVRGLCLFAVFIYELLICSLSIHAKMHVCV